MSVVSVRLAEDVTQQLELLATATGRKTSFLVAEAIDAYLAQEAWQVQEVHAALPYPTIGIEVQRNVASLALPSRCMACRSLARHAAFPVAAGRRPDPPASVCIGCRAVALP